MAGRPLIGANAHPWRVVAELAALQWGCVAHGQLITVGLSEETIRHAIRLGRLQRLHRGVYALDSSPRELGREAAALLSVWPDATLTGRSVLIARRLLPAEAGRPIDVALLGAHRRGHSRPGIRVHRYRDLNPRQVHITDGLPMTTVERALLDAADELTGDPLQEVVDEALAARLTSRTKLRETADAAVGRRGRSELLALADARRPSTVTKRAAAALALKLIRQAGLPEPETEVMLFGFPADFYYAEARVVLEVDSHAWHGLVRANFNRDRRRDRVHRQNGLEVVRVTYDELKETPLVFISDLSATIARRLAARNSGELA